MYFDAIAKIVAERTGCDVADLRPDSKFSELGIDSLDTVELIMEFEKNWITRWRRLMTWISLSRAGRDKAHDQISNL